MVLDVNSWARYVARVTGDLKQADIAEKTGVAQTNVGRWLRGDPGLPRAESVVAFARAFGQSPIEALVAAGYLTAEEAAGETRTPISEYSTQELFDELRDRTLGG
jgi:transcriptional regulator with XRE-family HTH domain